jgi:Flp pilus assembly protein TadG
MSMITSSQALSGLTQFRKGRFRRLLARARRDTAATSAVELGLALPFLMGLAMTGAEVVSLAITHVKLNQLAITVADNASRAKQAQVNGAPRFREADANEVFQAAKLQAEDLDIPNRGRVILSSLQRNTDGGQEIRWQRCWGKTTWPSRYGTQGTGASGTAFQGMGYTTTKMTADASAAIMFVEVAYDYKPFFLGSILSPKVIRKEAALYVRDDRDLTQIYNPAPTAPVASC